MEKLKTDHGDLLLPVFMPDATRGVVRSLDNDDVGECGIQAVMVNTLHLSSHPGISVISELGGIHEFSGWSLPIASDSGGYQLFSLISDAGKRATVTARGFSYHLEGRRGRKNLTPENCIRRQLRLGTDIVFCLDHCTHPASDHSVQRESIDNTVRWAAKCKETYLDCVENRARKPLIFAVVQGGDSRELRRECAERLLEIGFDGYGYGGWPIGPDGNLLDSVAYTAELIPADFYKHALGIGKPASLVEARRYGYDLFDCVIPTRDARHRRLYIFSGNPEKSNFKAEPGEADFFECLYLDDRRHIRDESPIDPSCDCRCCRRYSRALLYHLFRVADPSAFRLATIHNLRFYSRLMEFLRTWG